MAEDDKEIVFRTEGERTITHWPFKEDTIIFKHDDNGAGVLVVLTKDATIELRRYGYKPVTFGTHPIAFNSFNFPSDFPKENRVLGFVIIYKIESTATEVSFYVNDKQIGGWHEHGFTVVDILEWGMQIPKRYEELNVDGLDIDSDAKLLMYILQDLEEKIFDTRPYNLIKSSGLIRQLIAENKPGSSRPGDSLGLQIADRISVPLFFQVGDRTRSLPGGRVTRPDPITRVTNNNMITQKLYINNYPAVAQKILGIDDFLNTPIAYWRSSQLTVYDFIKTIAESSGGIHKGEPKSMIAEKNRVLEFEKQFLALNSGASESMIDIGLIVLEAFKPVTELILKS